VLLHESQRVESFHGQIVINGAQKVLLKFPLNIDFLAN